MTKIIVFTDIHLGQINSYCDPAERFASGLAHVADFNADAELIVINGDLTHGGAIDDYEALKIILKNAPAPVQLMVGNHDNRENLLATFPNVEIIASNHIQTTRESDHATLIFLDTLQAPPYNYPFSHMGVLCDDRLAWLDTKLSAATKPCIIFMHHPPHDTGLIAMDSIKLGNGPAFYRLIKKHGNVRQIVCGHVHRTISGSHHGIPFCTFKSTVGQMPMLFDLMVFHMEAPEPAAYGILNITDDSVVVHTEDYGLSDLAALRAKFETNA